jgi:peroxiredoxin
MAAEIGSNAPGFTLPNQDRQPVTLSEELKNGPVVLAFFPAAFSGTCTSQMCALRDSNAELRRASARVLGVSVDTFFALKAWADAQHFDFSLLSDFNKIVIREYGVFNEDMIGLKGIAKRAVFVIDGNGTIRHREVLDDARNEPDYAKMRDAVARLGA